MKSISDNDLVQQLKTEKSASFELIYKFYFPSVSNYVKKNMGNEDDAKDIFQEAIIVLLQKVRKTDFILTSSLKTYLYAIAKNLWLKRLRDNKLISMLDFEEKYAGNEIQTTDFEVNTILTKEEKVANWLTKITTYCQNILKAIFYYNEAMDSLMKKMGWKNKHVAANQQYKCIQQVKKEKKNEQEGIQKKKKEVL